jgi:hypothetical protein
VSDTYKDVKALRPTRPRHRLTLWAGYLLNEVIMIAVPVLGEIYRISFAHLPNALGECDPFQCTIKLADDIADQEEALWRVVRHELGHAFVFESGLGDYMNKREQEMMAQLLGNFFLIFDRPVFFKNLLAESKKKTEHKDK